MKQNIGKTERAVRVVVGVGILSLAFVGPASPWGFFGLVPLATGLTGWCLPYELMGIDTSVRRRDTRAGVNREAGGAGR